MYASFLLILLILKINLMCSKIISIPFKFKTKSRNYNSYDSSDFLNEYYKKDLLLNMDIGTPPQKILASLNTNSYCFEFKPTKSNSSNIFYPYKSTTFKIDKIENTQNKLIKYITSNDIFNFHTKERYKLSFIISGNLNESTAINSSLIPDIGINNPVPFYGIFYLCKNLITDLKDLKEIDKKIFSIKYEDDLGGLFIIGNNLCKYDSFHFKEEQYYTKYFVWDFMFTYDNIYIKNYLNKIDYLNITGNNIMKEGKINLNSGLIIGTLDFKNFIYEKFFKNLIEKNICSLDLVKYNGEKTYFDLGNDFYIFSCDHMQFTGQINQGYRKINYYSEFPNLMINSKSFEYDFELTSKDLFKKIFDKDYFLIVFPESVKDQKNKDIWYLGGPFYKKYPFTIDLDAKTIGFYLNKKDVNKKINDSENIKNKDNNRGKNKITNDNNSKIKTILIRIF